MTSDLAMFPPDVGHEHLPLGEQTITVSTCPSRGGGLLGRWDGVDLLEGRGRLLVPPVQAVGSQTILGVGAGGHGVGGLGAEGQVDAQVRGTLDGLQGAVHRLQREEGRKNSVE